MLSFSAPIRTAIGGLVLSLCLSASPSLCGAEQELLFEDDFSVLDGSFDPGGLIKAAVADNVLTINGDPGYWRRLLYQSSVFEDVDLSAEFQLGSPDAEKNAYVGLVIWGRDYDDFTCAAISDTATLGAFSNTPTNQMTKISWRQLEGLKRGPNDWNLLRVVTIGKRAAVYLNGSLVGTFKGKPVEGGNLIGMIYSTGSEASSARVRNLKVLTPKGDEIKSSADDNDPNVILSDDFTELDAGWGQESASLSIKDQKLILKPDPGFSFRPLYQGEAVTEIDATVKMHLNDNDTASVSSGGVTFWATGSGVDFFAFLVSDQGTCGVSHRTKDRWLTPLAYKTIPSEAKFDANGTNELRVVTSGKKATLYVNGVSVGTITSGLPIKGDWQFGLYAENGTAQVTAEFSSLRVRRPPAAPK